MKKLVVLFIMTMFIQACVSNVEKHELKSPCVSADSLSLDSSHPCQKRPANQRLG